MTFALAALVHDGHGIAEPVLHAFVAQLKAQGVRVRGLLQRSEVEMSAAATFAVPSLQDEPQASVCQRHMELIDIDNGDCYRISQDLGKGSTACCLDSAGVVEASVVLRRALQDQMQRPALIVANRFGKIEVEGSGLRQEMAAAVEAGVPLLTAVDLRFLAEWKDFTGDLGVILPPDVPALQGWWQTCQGASKALAVMPAVSADGDLAPTASHAVQQFGGL
ncbi:DUF2478 domain-containing protein [Lampropedia puyangensis]|uniref:DUF2478 domain-containing protein n=1 Tax=Lampropedia puyangensis TaxID=1330072 RepID=A0A4S8FCG3_9BURK|nr:DUF2478 domain-containing protein [Lampropedia puyangensis]THU04545.1 DUF2478 domain-containing protein [Lampropedia puyangensis]